MGAGSWRGQQAACAGWWVCSSLAPKLFCFFSLSPPLSFLSSSSPCPLLLPLSPAAMNPLLKFCHTHHDLPTSPPCPARRPALLTPCSRNCPVPADAGSKALVPCSNRTRCPFFVCHSGQVGAGPGSPLSPVRGSSCHLAAAGRLLSLSLRGDCEGGEDLTSLPSLCFLLEGSTPRFPLQGPRGWCWGALQPEERVAGGDRRCRSCCGSPR